MKYLSIILLSLLSISFLACEEDEKLRQAEALRAERQTDSIFRIISSNWHFNIPPASPKVQARISNWNEWQQFKAELAQKPEGPINDYRQKVKNLAEKADLLRNNIPPLFDKPQVRSRIGVLTTKIKSLYTFITIDIVPDKKITGLLNEITTETISIQNQFDEIIRISEIPKEVGEEEMLRALDTVRMANPGAQPRPQVSPERRPSNNINLQRSRRMQQLKPLN